MVNFRIRPASNRGAEQAVHADKLKKCRTWADSTDTESPVVNRPVGGALS